MSIRFIFSGCDLSQRDDLMPPASSRQLPLQADDRRGDSARCERHSSALTAAVLSAALTFSPLNLLAFPFDDTASDDRVPMARDVTAAHTDRLPGTALVDDDERVDRLLTEEALRRLGDTEDETMPYSEARRLLGLE